MIYNAKDIVLRLGQRNHTEDCSSHKTNARWEWVSLEVISEFIKKEGLFSFAHTIGDCIGFHVDDTPESEMKAKTCFNPDGTHYAIVNKDYKYYACDCDGEVYYTDIKGFSDNKITITKMENNSETTKI